MKTKYNVAILLSTYNGEKYLEQQLKSLENQKNVNLTLYVIDDNSSDFTKKILEKSKLKMNLYYDFKYRNPVKNFIKLIYLVDDKFDFYAFCDQDDVWLKNKLSYSIFKMIKNNSHICGSRTLITDKNLRVYAKSPHFKKKPSLKNSLVQSIAGGNTLVWSNKFHKFIKSLPIPSPASHDWYLYQVATYFKFNFLYIDRCLVKYRQHGNNVIGSNLGIINTLKRIILGLKGNYKYMHEINKIHFFNFFNLIENQSDESKDLVKKFYLIRSTKKQKLSKLIGLGVYRQTLQGQAMLYIATILNKI